MSDHTTKIVNVAVIRKQRDISSDLARLERTILNCFYCFSFWQSYTVNSVCYTVVHIDIALSELFRAS